MVNSSEDKKTGFSIKLKFILGIAILVVLIVGLNSYNSSQRESALLQESMDQSGKLLSSTLAIACQDPIISQSYDAFIPYTERIIAGGQDIQEISILDIDGRYLAHKVRDDSESKLGQVVDDATKIRLDSIENTERVLTDDSRFVDYISPIKIGISKFGTVILRFSFDRLEDNKSTSRNHILLIALIGFLAGCW